MTTDNRTNEQIVAEELAYVTDECSCHRSTTMDLARDAIAALTEAGRLAGGQLSGNTGQFTEAQVEAAAKAMHGTGNPWFAAYGDWGAAGFEIKKAFREAARAALEAAAGVAPQAEGDTTGQLLASEANAAHLRRGIKELSAPVQPSIKLTPRAQEHWDLSQIERAKFRDRGCACELCELIQSLDTVQPSSTVDEGKIADEMERHRHVMVAPGPHECSCGFVLPEDPGFVGWAREHKLHVARAVVAAIGGESRGSR